MCRIDGTASPVRRCGPEVAQHPTHTKPLDFSSLVCLYCALTRCCLLPAFLHHKDRKKSNEGGEKSFQVFGLSASAVQFFVSLFIPLTYVSMRAIRFIHLQVIISNHSGQSLACNKGGGTLRAVVETAMLLRSDGRVRS